MYSKKTGRMTYKSNRRTNFKRSGNFPYKGKNKGNITQQYNKYLKLAKDSFSSGDRIQSEYYYQFTDHYFRVMLELGINIDDQENLTISKQTVTENESSEIKNQNLSDNNKKSKAENDTYEDESRSIESIPFISEPIQKKKTKSAS
tara:strand:- start:1035 stop:1472 length:438 start_codon:yes stop_codon:yes gene_type:complete